MDDFKPHLHLLKITEKKFVLSVVLLVEAGYHLKKAPKPVIAYIDPKDHSKGKKHVVYFEFVSDRLGTSSIIDTTVQLIRKGEVKVEVVVIPPGRPNPTGSSSAHYADPDKRLKMIR